MNWGDFVPFCTMSDSLSSAVALQICWLVEFEIQETDFI